MSLCKKLSRRSYYLFNKPIVTALILSFAAIASVHGRSEVKPKPTFTIIYTAESHAALLPCDCPLEPLGGVARRATVIEKYRTRGPVLLVDGGGWAAGGLYDENSDGDEKRDRLRTQLMADSMAAMKYDAIGWGRVEWNSLRYENDASLSEKAPYLKKLAKLMLRPMSDGKVGDNSKNSSVLPFLASNAMGVIHKTLGKIKISVAALSPANLKPGSALTLEIKAIKEFVKDTTDSKFRILLNPRGEESSERLARKGSGIDLVLNAGRKSSQRTAWRLNGTTIVNFNFQVQKLLVIEVYRTSSKTSPWKILVKEDSLTPSIADHAQMGAVINSYQKTLTKKGKQRVELEYWMMGHCPYCKDVREDLEKISADLTDRLHLVPHFLVGKNDKGGWTALHGEAELKENKVLALIWKYYPEKFWTYLEWREDKKNTSKSWEVAAAKIGILKARIRGALASGEADDILEQDYQLSLRRKIEGTPTLILSNRPYSGEVKRMKLLRVLCGALEAPKPDICKSVPACFLDIECKQRGFIGACANPGATNARCDFSRKAVLVDAVVVVEPDVLWSNHEKILKILLDYLPGIKWRMVSPVSDEGKKLVSQFKLKRFPAYLLSTNARKELKFKANLDAVTTEVEGRLILTPQTTGAHRLATRKRIRGQADLFVARFSKFGQQAVTVALEILNKKSELPDLRIRDALFWRPKKGGGLQTRELAAQGGISEIEEAAIGLAVQETAPDKWLAYLKARNKRRASIYWDRALQEAGIDVNKVRALSEGPAPRILKRMHETADVLKELRTGGKVILLAENCEIIPVTSRKELAYYLERIGQRAHDTVKTRVENKP